MDSEELPLIAEITAECRQRLLQYQEETRILGGEKATTSLRDEWIDNRIADFNLWASGIGALSKNRSSLDARLELRPDLRSMVIDLLQLLILLIEDCIELGKSSLADGRLRSGLRISYIYSKPTDFS